MITVNVLVGPPGAGKSTQMLREMAAQPARYLCASPIIDLIDEQVASFRLMAPFASCAAIHSAARLTGSVKRNIADLSTQFPPDSHVAAFVTHEGLLDADGSKLRDWHARIDETPNAIGTGVLTIRESVPFLRDLYDLTPLADTGWSAVTPRHADRNWAAMQRDDLARPLINFQKYAQRRQGLIIDIDDWSEGEVKKDVEWFAHWSPLNLEKCSSITLTGAGFFNSIVYKICEKWFDQEISFKKIPAANSHRSRHPAVCIHYFTQATRGTTALWGRSEGRYAIAKIGDWLAANVQNLGYWSGNEVVQASLEHRIAGTMTKPKLAGLNKLRHATSCAMIYSSKPDVSDRPLKTLFDMSDADITNAREVEDIVQFVYRGAIRNPAYEGSYDVYLYHLDQALALQQEMSNFGINNVQLHPVDDAGIMDVDFSRKGRQDAPAPAPMSTDRRRELGRLRTQRCRARAKSKKCAAGSLVSDVQNAAVKFVQAGDEAADVIKFATQHDFGGDGQPCSTP